jgi:hypothetical protein
VNRHTKDASKRRVRDDFEKAELQVRHIIWSWAEPSCETEEEFSLSNALFMMFLDSHEFAAALQSNQAVTQAKEFYKNRIYPNLEHLVFYKRKHLLHFDTNSNSAHEGTNRGMKSHAAPTNPQHTLEKATQVLSHQARLKALVLQSGIASKANSTTLWSDQPGQSQLVDLAVCLISHEYAEREFYDIVGPFVSADGNDIFWLVMRRDQETQDAQLGTVPKVKRVRKIERCGERGTLLCNCCYFARVGIPCRHIIALLDHILGDEFKGITVDDVRVFWRIDYFLYGMQPHSEMRSLLMKLRDTDTQGPVLPIDKVPPTIFMDDNHAIVKTYHLPATKRCLNYSQNHCQSALERYGNTSCPCHHGLSQEVYDYSNNDDVGNDFEADGMCDVFDYPSPQKKAKTVKEQGYELLKPRFDELVSLLGDSAADSQIISYCDSVYSELVMKVRADLAARLPKPQGRTVSSAAPTSKRLKTHGTQHYSKHKRK